MWILVASCSRESQTCPCFRSFIVNDPSCDPELMNRSGGSRYKQRVVEVFVFLFQQSQQLLFLLFYVVPIIWQSRWNVSHIREPLHRPLLEAWPIRFLHFQCCNLVTQLNRSHSWGLFSSVMCLVIFQLAESNERFSFHLQDFRSQQSSCFAKLQFPSKAHHLDIFLLSYMLVSTSSPRSHLVCFTWQWLSLSVLLY